MTKERILDAALKLFCSQGYDATGIVQLAEEVGVRSATLYWHFPNKEAILEALVAPAADAMDAVLVRHRDSGTSGRRLLRDYLDALLAYRQVVCFLVADAAVRHHPTVGPRLDAQQASLRQALSGVDPSEAQAVAAAAAVGAVWRPVVALDEDHVRRCAETVVDAAVRALGAGRTQRQR